MSDFIFNLQQIILNQRQITLQKHYFLSLLSSLQDMLLGQSSFILFIIQMNQSISPRKNKKEAFQEPEAPKNLVAEFFKLILPPFVISIVIFLFRMTIKILVLFFSLFFTSQKEIGEASTEFRKRNYELPIESLKVKQEDLGFTNQVLVQQNKKTFNFFLPVYITNKIKSIQDVSVQSLTSNISCAIIINIHFGDIPEEIIKKLENSIVVQLSGGQSMILADDGITITTKRDKKARFLIFTLRKVFLGFLIQDTLWSPFQMLRLIISITLNTVTIPANSLEPLQPKTGYNPNKQYKISFNCMRNSDLIPMSFALDCVYGVYDLAQRLMESYHTNLGTYKEVQKKYEQYQQKKKSKKGKQQKKQKKQEKKELQKRKPKQEKPNEQLEGILFVKQIAQTTIKRLSMRAMHNEIKPPPKKVKYFQYTHFVIPLYKYPGNYLITIFLPILMLALLSLAIFFQDSELSGRIGAIATMILGYIALIPSIKQQLPPSSKLTVVQFLVYIQALSCMLCLYESFIIRDLETYQFIWYENINFLLCLSIHGFIFLFIAGLYFIHKVKWQPQYNCDEKVPQIKPAESPQSWDNPYCDQIFLKFNKQVMQKQIGATRDQMLIKPYKNLTAAEKTNNKHKNFMFDVKDNAPVSLSEFQSAPSQGMLSSEVKSLVVHKPPPGILDFLMNPTSPRSNSEFVIPDQQLYYQKKMK